MTLVDLTCLVRGTLEIYLHLSKTKQSCVRNVFGRAPNVLSFVPLDTYYGPVFDIEYRRAISQWLEY